MEYPPNRVGTSLPRYTGVPVTEAKWRFDAQLDTHIFGPVYIRADCWPKELNKAPWMVTFEEKES